MTDASHAMPALLERMRQLARRGRALRFLGKAPQRPEGPEPQLAEPRDRVRKRGGGIQPTRRTVGTRKACSSSASRGNA